MLISCLTLPGPAFWHAGHGPGGGVNPPLVSGLWGFWELGKLERLYKIYIFGPTEICNTSKKILRKIVTQFWNIGGLFSKKNEKNVFSFFDTKNFLVFVIFSKQLKEVRKKYFWGASWDNTRKTLLGLSGKVREDLLFRALNVFQHLDNLNSTTV